MRYKSKFLKIILMGLLMGRVFTQSAPFNVLLEPVNIKGLGGLQSFAFGQHEGKWLIVGGRLDGLHRRQPFAAFDLAGHNTQLIVVDPVNLQTWTSSLSSLPSAIQEQLKSTNMEFYQEGNTLYVVGGYGYSAREGDHTTFGNLTAIDVPATIQSIINRTEIKQFVRQISNPLFQVTGGHLEKIYDTYYLVGGQKFIGRYNPMGPTHGPGFTQDYTNQIRKFKLDDDGTNLVVQALASFTDAANLHRRDYNVTAQILPNGEEGLTAFSGVFQTGFDLPYLNCVNIDSQGYQVNNDFSQYYNHYHCANIPIYSKLKNEMHTLFFGGIAQYYDSAGILVQDNNVPFVKTIARVTRDSRGVMAEYKLPIEMPALLGAGSEFILNEKIAVYDNGVIKLDEITQDSIDLGYLYGGISSSAANIFWVNDGVESTASSQIFKVKLIRNSGTRVHEINKQSFGSLKLMAYPNPNDGNFILKYHLKKSTDVKISIYSIHGRIIETKIFPNMPPGDHSYEKRMDAQLKEGGCLLVVETAYEKATQKIIIEP
ncbi:MAG: T9SS type A sorting domain-containing protein [Saprospiraceae bacterium]|nr:T9SS type A sorting domain-containing protein [Candidatus Vicinibacter affinis]